MAAAYKFIRLGSNKTQPIQAAQLAPPPEFAGVFRGRALTRKDRRLPSGLPLIDDLTGGGIVRGRISEFFGPIGTGKTSLAMSFAAQATRTEVAAWIESGDNLDPESMLAAGIEPARMLWVSCRKANLSRPFRNAVDGNGDAPATNRQWRRQMPISNLKAAEWILTAGGFGLVILDFAAAVRFLPQSDALRLARAAERSGAAVIVLGERQLCGTFAVFSLALKRRQTCFKRNHPGSPATFDGQLIEAQVMRNKLGGSGRSGVWGAAIDQFDPPLTDRNNPALLRLNPLRKFA
jgi:hypothetical protein